MGMIAKPYIALGNILVLKSKRVYQMKTFIQSGNVVTLAAPAAVKSGDGVLVGSLFGVAAYDAAAGADVECSIVGVYELPKASGAINQGAKVYWVAADKNCSGADASGANKLIGAATETAGGADAKVRVRLNGVAIT
jgi:predicted RecA/RadA family phage recombinase